MPLLRILVAIVIALACPLAVAISPANYSFRDFPLNSELSLPAVHTIFQDSSGLLWFLTTDGLNRYDGYTIRTYKSSTENPKSINADYTTGIVEDSNGVLWISTKSGLNRFDPTTGEFKSISSKTPVSPHALMHDSITSIFQSSDNRIWIGYEEGSAFSIFDPSREEFIHYPLNSTEGRPTTVAAFSETPDGKMWAATENKGLLQLVKRPTEDNDLDIVTQASQFHQSYSPKHMIADRKGNLWIATAGQGILFFEPEKNIFTQYLINEADQSSRFTVSDSVVHVNMVAEDAQGNIWAATIRGVRILNKATNTFVPIDSSSKLLQKRNLVSSIFQDDSGLMWIAAHAGVIYGKKRIFGRVDNTSGMYAVNSFTQTSDGSLLVGTNHGLSKVTLTTLRVAHRG